MREISVLEILQNGWEAISTDQLAGEILASDKRVATVAREVGQGSFDERGIVDKKQIAEIVYLKPHEDLGEYSCPLVSDGNQ